MNTEYAIYIVVEGYSEERFVKDVLAKHLLSFNNSIRVIPIIVETSRDGCAKQKGGASTYPRIKKNILQVCNGHKNAIVTMMFDYYGFPRDIDGKHWDKGDGIEVVESLIKSSIDRDNFIPFLMKHEFETLLFSDTSCFGDMPGIEGDLNAVLKEFNDDPESINTDSSPSHRIEAIFKRNNDSFSKKWIGVPMTSEIGIHRMVERCPHFGEWVQRLTDSLGELCHI